jgi:lipopolysaccharide transport system permease protein
MAEVIVIEPGRYERDYWCDLWRYRELFRVIPWRDLAVRLQTDGDRHSMGGHPSLSNMLVLLISGRAIRLALLIIPGVM